MKRMRSTLRLALLSVSGWLVVGLLGGTQLRAQFPGSTPAAGQLTGSAVRGGVEQEPGGTLADHDGAGGMLEPLPFYAEARSLRQDASLAAVAFADAEIGIACGDRGTILRTADGGQTWSLIHSGIDCALEDVIWLDRQRVVIVGGGYDRITRISRGVVLRSNDAGSNWTRSDDAELPKLRTLSVRQTTAGRAQPTLVARGDWSHSLLTSELESHDGGRSWNDGGRGSEPADSKTGVPKSPPPSELQKWVRATRAHVPIRDACRVGDQRLCAVGDQGVIVLSDDRGRSWIAARGDKRRSAVLVVSNDPASVAWSMIGNEVLENRNRVALLLREATWHDHSQAPPLDVARQAMTMLGGSSVDRIAGHVDVNDPAPSEVDSWAQAASQWIEIHRPSVLLLDDALPSPVQDAFFQAATSSGVARVVVYSFEGAGHTVLHSEALLPRCGVLASDLHIDAMQLVAPRRAQAVSVSVRYLYDAAVQSRRGDSVVEGMARHSGQALAASMRPASRRRLQIAQARMRQSQRVEELVRTSRSPQQFEKSLSAILDQTAKEDQLRLAWTLMLEAGQKQRGGEQQKITLDLLAERFANHSVGRWAKLRRDAIEHSHEWSRLRSSMVEPADGTSAGTAAQSVPVSPFQVPPSGVQQVSAVTPLLVPKPERTDLNMQQEKKTQTEVDLTWEFHPLVMMAREAARRRGDRATLQPTDGESANLRRLAEASESDWARLLRTDARSLTVRRASHPPRLDGELSDECWQSALPLAGRSPQLRFAYDDDFIYVAIQWDADQFRTDADPDAATTAIRDHDLTNVDRLRLRFDLDRDLMTSMQLQVTAAGRTHDSVDGNPAWQPTWYVDTQRGTHWVTAEMAILRRDLAELPIPAGESWFVSVDLIRAGSVATEAIVPLPSEWTRMTFQP